MPREDRRILFDYSEVYQAIYALCAKRDLKKPPAGAIQNIEEAEGDENTILVHLENPQETWDPKQTVEYKRDFVAAAMMMLCKGSGIPLPKTAQKSVMIHDGNIILRVLIG
ncbi:MAG: hypothetical protein ACPGRX_02365 [Bdellovibrionales bacterium]